MLQEIMNASKPAMPAISVACAATGLFMGRKFFQAGSCKIAGVVLDKLGIENAEAWNKAGDEHWKIAKENGLRDLTAVTGLLALSFLAALQATKTEKKNKELNVNTPLIFSAGIVTGWNMNNDRLIAAQALRDARDSILSLCPDTPLFNDLSKPVVVGTNKLYRWLNNPKPINKVTYVNPRDL